MRILHTVEFYEPSVGGAQEVIKQLSERLVKLGHEVTIATTKLKDRKFAELNGVKIVEFDIRGNMVKGFTGDVEKYRSFLLKGDFDVMMNYAAQQWSTDLALPLLDRIKMKKVLVPCGFSSLNDPNYSDYYSKMKEWLRKYDACVYLSNDYRDVNFARSNGISNGRLIPNGCAADEFDRPIQTDIRKELGIPESHLLILHVGSHTGLKGHSEAMRIFQKARIDHSTLLIVGNDFGTGCKQKCSLTSRAINLSPRSRLKDKRIILSSLDRPSTVAAYQQADLFLFPSNIECSPIVLFEAMASRTPFLCTDVGNSKEIIEWSQAGILLPTTIDKDRLAHAHIRESAKMLQAAVNDPEGREKMASNGFDAWKNKFTWEGITSQYEDLYLDLLKGRSNS